MEKKTRTDLNNKWIKDKSTCMKFIAVRRRKKNDKFIPKVHQDTHDFLISFLDKLCEEN